MADPVTSTLADVLKVVDGGIKLNIAGSLPGETVIAALINYATLRTSQMDAGLQKRLDAVLVEQVEDMQAVNRGIWKALGVIK